MNHLLHPITWHQYLTAALIAALIYYAVVILRCYQPELQQLKDRFSGNANDDGLQALRNYNGEADNATAVPAANKNDLAAHQPYQEIPDERESQEPPTALDIISLKLKAVIEHAADQPFAPALLIPQLQQLLQEPQTFSDAEKAAISHLIVAECENTGTALLTEEEVDQWWER
ncbi:hypothetical protein [Mucilaginibacter sp. AK015]|uniref:hypothetical protein n=1 Tax=Mucilaginibacter sp. AK015 TaxID=2723072 RepID=UPI00160C48F4|nr:hypothetical protein [Mucilaginibacter sp. AK015]MBB5396667.1 hypothetical protein [Mucilaginibacter sp. AK015]